MIEFFDHYLQGAPAPDWMMNGIPRLKMEEHLKENKVALAGLDYRYVLDEDNDAYRRFLAQD